MVKLYSIETRPRHRSQWGLYFRRLTLKEGIRSLIDLRATPSEVSYEDRLVIYVDGKAVVVDQEGVT